MMVYQNLVDLLSKSDVIEPMNSGQSYILPSSFVGSARYMHQNFLDSLTICRNIGYPSIFLTMTCNPFWDEMKEMMKFLPTSNPEDYPDIIARVFKLKVEQMYDIVKNKSFFGKCIGGNLIEIIPIFVYLKYIFTVVFICCSFFLSIYIFFYSYVRGRIPKARSAPCS